MAQIEWLKNARDWQTAWDAQRDKNAGTVLIFKRSPTCPISHRAEAEFQRFTASLPASEDIRFLCVDVISERPVSQQIARDTGIQHESPQALLVGRGQTVLWSASHGEINEATLSNALSAANS